MAFIVQRASQVKVGFNTASYLLDVTAVIALAHLLISTPADLNLTTAALCYVSLAAIDVLTSALVLAVIRINHGPVTGDSVVEVFVSAGIVVALNTAAGFVCAVLLEAGPLGIALLAGFVAVTAASFRAYLVLRRRHRSLVEVQEYIGTGEGTHSVEGLAERMLPPVRELLRAAHVELTLRDVCGTGATIRSVDETGSMRTSQVAHLDPDEVWASSIQSGRALRLSGRTQDPAARRWLQVHGASEALIAPLVRSELEGTLVVLERLGDSTHFTADDLALLQTLAGHLAVALHSVQLFEQLLHEATHDVLTDLPNRSLLASTLRTMLSDADDERAAAVLLLDLDRFRDVNDALGHDIGDQLLQVVARRLSELVPAGATVGRLGGDEFAVLLPPAADAQVAAFAVATTIANALRTPVQLPDVTISTEGTIGVAIATAGQTQTDLMRQSDTAMYAAKDSGVQVVIYTAELERGGAERLSLLTDLRAALDRQEIEVYYQPKADLARNVVTSVEALVRWTHPTLGPVGPAEFIPLAESTGLIDLLTRTVLTKALQDCRLWRDAGHEIAVAVNVSARNVNDACLPDMVAAALETAGVPARALILEITESSIMGDPVRTLPTLTRLATLGVALSIDDFGTGYSSLSYLQRLPVHELKIDLGFVQGMAQKLNPQGSEVLVRDIVGLGHSLDLRVVAEGVDSARLLEQLRDLDCDLAQGFYLSRPVPYSQLFGAIEQAELACWRA
ncbi:putative bifunctional diguanylate cyclase/phosphodiesterase [Pengzhenrongella phosphoraccumulans]|uniref:putative bifunctional diguanylate cyclase/phosphodiesterase n=1 Tax=Pengzhenrongella phosphoraccumulans TaxID=3114394 RepID=UPI00389024E2